MNKPRIGNKEKSKKPQHPLSGLSIVASLWLWGSILFYAPIYFGISGGWRIPFNLFGTIAIIISFAGALIELGKYWKNEGWSYWGVGLVFLIPSVILFSLVKIYTMSPILLTTAKIGALVLLALSGPFIFMGIPYFFWREPQAQILKPAKDIPKEEAAAEKLAKREARFTTIASIIIACLSLATAVVKLVLEIMP